MSLSKLYFARITTKAGFCRVWKASCVLALFLIYLWLKLWFFEQVRVPFSAFRPVNPEDPPLDPFLVHTLTIRFEPKRQVCLPFSMIQRLFWGFDRLDHYQPNTFFHSLVCEFSNVLGFFNLFQRPVDGVAGAQQDLRSFSLVFEYIKALPVSSTQT